VAAGRGSHVALFRTSTSTTRSGGSSCATRASRRALSLAIDRSLVNQVLYFGLAVESNNTVLEASRSTGLNTARCGRVTTRKRRIACSTSSASSAAAPASGSCRRPAARDHRRDRGRKHRADGRARADTRNMARGRHQALQQAVAARGIPQPHLCRRDHHVGVERPRERLPTADNSPDELAPTSQLQLQWPKFGQYYETGGKSGEAPTWRT